MRPVIYVLSFLALMALGFWAYRENYATQAALGDVAALQDEIADLQEALAIQRAEWAYLNRPDRLRELASVNFDRLGLMPLEPDQLNPSIEISYPQAEVPVAVVDAIDTVGSDLEQAPSGAEEQTP